MARVVGEGIVPSYLNDTLTVGLTGRVGAEFRVEQRHCNPAGILHGGMMMTVADMTAGFGTAF